MKRATVCQLGILFLVWVLPLMSDDQPAMYTRIANWHIARANWDAYEKNFQKLQNSVFEKLLSDGVITEYGFDAVTVHTVDGATHSTWFSAKSIAGLERALETLQSAVQKLSPEERKKQDTDF